jgi:hypothetical protein
MEGALAFRFASIAMDLGTGEAEDQHSGFLHQPNNIGIRVSFELDGNADRRIVASSNLLGPGLNSGGSRIATLRAQHRSFSTNGYFFL